MNKYIFILIALLFWSDQIEAQVPGYQGRRFFAELGGSFFFNFGFPTAQNKGPQSFPFSKHTGHFTLKDRYSLSLHYIIGRKTTFKLAYHYQVSGLYEDQTRTPSLFANGFDAHDLFYQLHAHDVNIGFNLYGSKNSNLAPLGFYWDVGFRFVFVNGVLADQRVEYYDNRQDNTPYTDQLSPITENTFMFMFGVTGMWGYRTVLADRLILNVGLETTFFPQYPINLIGLPIIGRNPGAALTNYQRRVTMAIQDRYLFSIHIGVGALII